MAEEPASSISGFAQGYGALIAVIVAIVIAALVIPVFNVLGDAPEHVTEADIAAASSPHSSAGWAATAYPGGARRPMPPCQRDQLSLGIARFLHLPQSMLLRIEYVQITDCQPH